MQTSFMHKAGAQSRCTDLVHGQEPANWRFGQRTPWAGAKYAKDTRGAQVGCMDRHLPSENWQLGQHTPLACMKYAKDTHGNHEDVTGNIL